MKDVKVFNEGEQELPKYSTPQSAGLDLRSDEDMVIQPFENVCVATGLHGEWPEGYVFMICSRSGLAAKNCVIVLNAPGLVDADYRGHVKINLMNLGKEPFVIHKGDRIAQGVLVKFEQVNWVPVGSMDDLSTTERGEGGFGHSGVH